MILGYTVYSIYRHTQFTLNLSNFYYSKSHAIPIFPHKTREILIYGCFNPHSDLLACHLPR
jgi:hypothetical protein